MGKCNLTNEMNWQCSKNEWALCKRVARQGSDRLLKVFTLLFVCTQFYGNHKGELPQRPILATAHLTAAYTHRLQCVRYVRVCVCVSRTNLHTKLI